MIEVATIVSQSGYVKLRDAFQIVSPCVSYTAERARRKLLQMPLASVTVGKPSDGNSYAILTECFKDERVGVLVNAMIQAQYQQVPKKLDKGCVRMLLNLAQNDRERECLKYTVIKASGISASESDQAEDRQRARALNGEVVSECESDDPEAYLSTTNPLSIASRRLVAKKRTAVKRRATRLKAKAIASANLLSKQVSKRCSTILRDCPDIGKTIESFVENGNVGADHWRRTGVLTFDGNARLEHKVTYGKIKSHLEKVYNRHISYGTVVQLCVPRNQRRRSAKRYRGVAHVTTRRARKGFNLRYNPDSHWSAALYKGLNDMQFKDGRNMMVLNRDDAAGFRLDTLVTSKQYGTPALQGHDVLTTRTDYVNKYPSTLQTTCYNFPSTGTTVELCAGIVKAPVHVA